MDLSQIAFGAQSDKGAWLHLESPVSGEKLFADADKNLPLRVKLLGAESKTYRDMTHSLQNERIKRSGRGMRAMKITAESLEDDALELLTAATVEFENLTLDGAPIVGPKIRETYLRFPWVRQQAQEFVAEVGNFSGE